MKNRRKARELALQALYAREQGGSELKETIAYLSNGETPAEVKDYARNLAQATLDHCEEIDEMIQTQTRHWKLERVATIDRNVLRMAIAELLHFKEIPPKVTIDEAIEIAKKFSTENSGKFVNGILDPIAKEKAHKAF